MPENKALSIFWSTISLAISAAFMFIGYDMSRHDPPFWIKSCGYLTILYGSINAVIVAAAWLRAPLKLNRISTYSAIIYLSLALIASLDVGMISGLEWVGLIIIAMLLSVNWYTVRYIVKMSIHG